ncbi:MAG: AAA family ATPase [Candidatus Omnitrophica bacterium]|nr:AAA family ATPase [Candidatus Omnitrophota bacterium]
MYKNFYGLKENPFNATSDPHFLYLSKRHKEALSSLVYGINERKGFIEITGEIGTGKTTLCRALLNELDAKTKTAFILNPRLSEMQLVRAVIEDFGIMVKRNSKIEMIKALNEFLIKQLSAGNNVVLIIDESQNLKNNILEEIRLLSNLETEKEKLFQIVLVGQPELKQKLASPDLVQLKQRISIRYHILPLERHEISAYLQHRLHVAGGHGDILFDDSAIDEIYEYSKGVPRLINIVSDRAMLLGYVQEIRTFDSDIIKRAVAEIENLVLQQ